MFQPFSRQAKFLLLPVFFLPGLLSVSVSHACDSGTVRDAAFRARREVYRLDFVAPPGDAAAEGEYRRLEQWFAENGAGLNVVLERHTPEDYSGPGAEGFDAASGGPFPRTYLSGGRFVKAWRGAPSEAELAMLRGSPALDAARGELTEKWAVVLYSRGVDEDRFAEVDAAARQWSESHPPGVTVQKVERDDPREALLCSLAGIGPDEPDWVAVVFGRGRAMIPMPRGMGVTRRAVTEQLNKLAVPCTCLQNTVDFAVDLPLFWELSRDAQVASLAGPQGYAEMTLDEKLAPVLDEIGGGGASRTTAAALPPLAPLLAMAGAAAAVTAFIIVRHLARKRRAAKERNQ